MLALIVIIAAFLRFYQLGNNPPSLNWDEVAWGYNAYSIGVDGKDEFGRFLPYEYFESYGDFKPPVYAYLSVLPVKLFGLNEFAVRFASALFGTLTVLITYYLTLRIFPKIKSVAILSTLIMALSPWHIMLSRASFEANVATFFIVSGVWLFLKAIQDKPSYLILSAVAFSLSIYTFNTARIVSPLILIVLAFGFRKSLPKIKKQVVFAVVVGLLLTLPTVKFLLSPQASLRFKEVNIFSDVGLIKKSNQYVENDQNAPWSKVIHNRRVIYSLEFVKHYLDHFNPSFLFITGDANPKFSTQDVGVMYPLEFPFLVIGILYILKKKEGSWWILPAWVLIGIFPAAVARETPHALRIESTLPVWQIVVAYGFVTVLKIFKKYKKYILIGPSIVYAFLVMYFLHGYYFHYPREFSGEWQMGYKDAINFAESVKQKYNKIYLSDVIGRPYMYTLFYSKYSPQQFRKESEIKRDPFGFVHVLGFGKYKFVGKGFQKATEDNLYIAPPGDVPKDVQIIKNFYLLNGGTVLVAYQK